MTDLELYVAMLERAGFKFSKDECPTFRGMTQISVQQTNGLFGYGGFSSDHLFDKDGKLFAIGGYE